MITDEDVVQWVRNIVLNAHANVADSDMIGRSRQIYMGIPGHLWKDAHPLGCIRHMAVFKQFDVIPNYCFECYKVLITPRSVVELFKLLMIFEKVSLTLDNTRKCMVEGRDNCAGAYKGYIYCRGDEDGNQVLKILRKVVSEDISPQVAVSLKRGCSEYALVYPEYAQIKPGSTSMQYKKDWQGYEEFFDKNYGLNKGVASVNNDEKINDEAPFTPWDVYSMKYWLRYAATIGDSSYLAITGVTLPPLKDLKRPPLEFSIPQL